LFPEGINYYQIVAFRLKVGNYFGLILLIKGIWVSHLFKTKASSFKGELGFPLKTRGSNCSEGFSQGFLPHFGDPIFSPMGKTLF